MVYSFLDNQATLSGPGASAIPLGAGAAVAEEGITIDFVEDKDTMHVGADGETVHSLHATRAATATVRLLKTSPTNALLSAMYAYQASSSLFWGQNTLLVANSALGDLYDCQEVAFAKFPSNTWAKDAGFLEWRFNVAKCYPTLGAGAGTLL